MFAAHKHFAAHQVSGVVAAAYFKFQCYNITYRLPISVTSSRRWILRTVRTWAASKYWFAWHERVKRLRTKSLATQICWEVFSNDSIVHRRQQTVCIICCRWTISGSNENKISLFPQLPPFAYSTRPKSFRWNCFGWFVLTMSVHSSIDYEPWGWMRFLRNMFSCKRTVSRSKRLNFRLRPCDARK